MSPAPTDEQDWVVLADRSLGRLDLAVESDLPVAPLCTYRVGGAARRSVQVESAAEAALLAEAVAAAGVGGRTAVVGRGSNLLVADSGFDGLLVRLGEGLTQVSVDGTSVLCGGAASLPVVARRTVAEGLTGFEWAVGVPGSMGGAVAMNAGGHGSDMSAAVVRVRVHDFATGETHVMTTGQLAFGYRRSAVGRHQVVSEVELGLERGDRSEGEATISEIVRWRRENQPGGQNAGSVFTNPPGDSAGRLIEQAGCKGLRVGTAEVSTKHANFIQADRGGSADDVMSLMAEVARRVEADSGVELHAETRLLGFDR